MERFVRICFILCLWTCFVYGARKLPDYVHVCKRNDPEISKCWRNTVAELRPYLVKGIPEFDIAGIEPFMIEKIRLDQGNTRSINFVANLTKLKFYGGGNYEVPYANADVLGTRAVNVGLTFPKLTMEGDYNAKGRVLLFEFEGNGKVEGEFNDVRMNGTWYFKVINKKGKEYFVIDKEGIDVELGKMSIYMHDLFRGSPEITKNVNNAINENIDALYGDFKPLLTTTLSTVSRQYFNRVFQLFPYDVLLPN